MKEKKAFYKDPSFEVIDIILKQNVLANGSVVNGGMELNDIDMSGEFW